MIEWLSAHRSINLYSQLIVETTHRQRRHAVLYVLWPSSNFDHKVGRSGKTLLLLLSHGLAASGVYKWESGLVFTASMLTFLRLISLTVALAAGSARVTAIGASTYILK